ncbi:monovalent cation/H(+) antiporter subunit G [Mycetocola reblochoni]|uniref:Na(+) H(+) antiporter subunit G n=2 Tax=Mycetocola reblochoni TaxID=331618 RepID=A0A1R4JGT2_9MICO|nr:monovalent cation/H(+) antiporter subunit G [Mycetocola reblochoni]RLP69253.1 monovalent cation/H(+) antiporter subunit G [Mycetocola reblochoni]SJN31431.1 Na(+) H(+) antiporter subunit G [Mycetocola reblochoni REB411]
MTDFADTVTLVLVFFGALMCFAAGVGLLRFPDVLARLHAATKPQIFGLIVICFDIVLSSPGIGTITMAVAIIVFQALTAPVSAHLVSRAAYRSGRFRPESLIRDDLAVRMASGDEASAGAAPGRGDGTGPDDASAGRPTD